MTHSAEKSTKYKCLFTLLEMFKISEAEKIPENIISILIDNSSSIHKKLLDFVTALDSAFIKPGK